MCPPVSHLNQKKLMEHLTKRCRLLTCEASCSMSTLCHCHKDLWIMNAHSISWIESGFENGKMNLVAPPIWRRGSSTVKAKSKFGSCHTQRTSITFAMVLAAVLSPRGGGGGGLGYSNIWAIWGCTAQQLNRVQYVFFSLCQSGTGSTNQRFRLEQRIRFAHSDSRTRSGSGLPLSCQNYSNRVQSASSSPEFEFDYKLECQRSSSSPSVSHDH